MVNCKLPFWDFGVRKCDEKFDNFREIWLNFGVQKVFDDSTTVFQLGFVW